MYEIWNGNCYLYNPSQNEDPFKALNSERKHNPRAHMILVQNGTRTVVSSDPVVVPQIDEEEEDFDYDEYSD